MTLGHIVLGVGEVLLVLKNKIKNGDKGDVLLLSERNSFYYGAIFRARNMNAFVNLD